MVGGFIALRLQSNSWFELAAITISRERGVGQDYLDLVARRTPVPKQRVQLNLHGTGRPKTRSYLCCDCGARIDPDNKRCRVCYRKHQVATMKGGYICPQCGGGKSRSATLCRACHDENVRKVL